MILHITSKSEWLEAQALGEYRAPSLETEGFIHCSAEAQVVAVANAFYRGRNDLVLLMIEETRARPEVKWEAPAEQHDDEFLKSSSFPHVYGALNLDAVVGVRDFPPNEDGTFTLPALNV